MEMKSAVPRERSYTEISPPVMTPPNLSCRGSYIKRKWVLLWDVRMLTVNIFLVTKISTMSIYVNI